VERKGLYLLALPLLLLLGAAMMACSSDGDDDSDAVGAPPAAATSVSGSDSTAAASIAAVEKDGTITLDKSSASGGEVEFQIDNQGQLKHQFVIVKTDLDPAALPQVNGAVDEKADGLTVIKADDDIAPGAKATLSADLDSGKYVLICNVAGHYQLGMHAPLTVQ
jgi:uncharacterized cupredoxin-like copper-binding protein